MLEQAGQRTCLFQNGVGVGAGLSATQVRGINFPYPIPCRSYPNQATQIWSAKSLMQTQEAQGRPTKPGMRVGIPPRLTRPVPHPPWARPMTYQKFFYLRPDCISTENASLVINEGKIGPKISQLTKRCL